MGKSLEGRFKQMWKHVTSRMWRRQEESIGVRRRQGDGPQEGRPLSLVYVVTVPGTARSFLSGKLRYMQSAGFAVSLISSPSEVLDDVGRSEGIAVHGVPMARPISLLAD